MKNDQTNIFTLPPEEETTELIRTYFSNTGRLYPYIHEDSFWETYSLVRQNMFPKVHRTWLGLLNMVLVMATITAVLSFVPARTRISKSDVYYQRALGLSGKEILRGTTLEIGKG